MLWLLPLLTDNSQGRINDMKTINRPLLTALINSVLFAVLLLFHYSGRTLKIGNANPFAALALLVAVIMFASELTSVISGTILGIIIDSVAITPIGFNTITLMIISLAASLISHYLFNRNLKSALVLSLVCAAAYFGARWLVTFAFGNDIAGSFSYLFSYGAMSAVYTSLFIIPFFYLEKRLFSKI